MGREIEHQDEDLLEVYLDGELAPDGAEALALRLAREPELVAALERTRAERALRRAVWSSCEPDASAADALAEASVAVALREDRFRRAARLARRATAAAAVVLLAFAGGWLARGRAAPDRVQVARPVSSGDHTFASSGADGPTFPVTGTDARGNVAAFTATIGGARVRSAMQVDQVNPGSPAHRAGVRVGDVVLAVAGESVSDLPALAAMTARGGPTEMQLFRDGRTVKVVVDVQPE